MQRFRNSLILILAVMLATIAAVPAYAQGGETLAEMLAKLEEAGWTLEQVTNTEWAITDGEQTITITLSAELPDVEEEVETEEPVDTLASSERFNVVPTSNVNLRGCPATTCDLVGTATTSDVIEVLAIETDDQDREWYGFETEDGEIAYIAAWLTQRGPDIRLTQSEIEDVYFDEKTNCAIALQLNRGRSDMAFAITGDAYYDVFVDLYRPSDTSPLNVQGQYPKTFIDTGEPYIHQTYYASFPAGVYKIEVTGANGEISVIEFEYENVGDAVIFVMCE